MRVAELSGDSISGAEEEEEPPLRPRMKKQQEQEEQTIYPADFPGRRSRTSGAETLNPAPTRSSVACLRR